MGQISSRLRLQDPRSFFSLSVATSAAVVAAAVVIVLVLVFAVFAAVVV